jgi:hypothetical protein
MGKVAHGGESMPITYLITYPRRDRVWQAAAGQDMPQIPLLSREDGKAPEVPLVLLFLVEAEGYRVNPSHVEAIRALRASGGYSSQRVRSGQRPADFILVLRAAGHTVVLVSFCPGGGELQLQWPPVPCPEANSVIQVRSGQASQPPASPR